MFRRIFRREEPNIEKVLGTVHSSVERAAYCSLTELTSKVEANWAVSVEQDAHWLLLCEWYLFYNHLLDWWAFQILGELRRNIVVDCWVEVGLVPFVAKRWPNHSKEERNAVVGNLMSSMYDRNGLYAKAPQLFARLEKTEPVDPWLFPGFEDSVLDEPTAKITPLAKNIHTLLWREVPAFSESDFTRGSVELMGTNAADVSFLTTFPIVVMSAMTGIKQSELPVKIQDVQHHLR